MINFMLIWTNWNYSSQFSHFNIQNNANESFRMRVGAWRETMSSYNIYLLLDIHISDPLLTIKQFLLWGRCSMVNRNDSILSSTHLSHSLFSLNCPISEISNIFFPKWYNSPYEFLHLWIIPSHLELLNSISSLILTSVGYYDFQLPI